MGKKLNERVGALEYDELIIGSHPVADVVLVDLAAGSGIIKRGTVIIGDPGGTFAPIAAAASAGKALYIVAEDVDITGSDPVTATVYRSGKFNRQRLLTNGTYTLAKSDEEYLRLGNILLDDAI